MNEWFFTGGHVHDVVRNDVGGAGAWPEISVRRISFASGVVSGTSFKLHMRRRWTKPHGDPLNSCTVAQTAYTV